MSDRAWKYWRGVLWFGVRLYDLWQMPEHSHACALELIAMEAAS